MIITKDRFKELGLGCDKSDCIFGENCKYAKRCDTYDIAPCVDEERLKAEMSEAEYDAFRHNKLKVE